MVQKKSRPLWACGGGATTTACPLFRCKRTRAEQWSHTYNNNSSLYTRVRSFSSSRRTYARFIIMAGFYFYFTMFITWELRARETQYPRSRSVHFHSIWFVCIHSKSRSKSPAGPENRFLGCIASPPPSTGPGLPTVSLLHARAKSKDSGERSSLVRLYYFTTIFTTTATVIKKLNSIIVLFFLFYLPNSRPQWRYQHWREQYSCNVVIVTVNQ